MEFDGVGVKKNAIRVLLFEISDFKTSGPNILLTTCVADESKF